MGIKIAGTKIAGIKMGISHVTKEYGQREREREIGQDNKEL